MSAIGQPLSRVDGRLKVTGAARYAADIPIADLAHAAIVHSRIANGRTVLNNKGQPVKQYEPYFSPAGHHFEEPQETGVSPTMRYDALGRLVRTDLPDGTFSTNVFSPWHVTRCSTPT